MNKNTIEGGEMIIGRKYSWKMNWRQDKLLSVEKRILKNLNRIEIETHNKEKNNILVKEEEDHEFVNKTKAMNNLVGKINYCGINHLNHFL